MLHLNIGLHISSAFSLAADDKNRGSAYKPHSKVATLTPGCILYNLLLQNMWHNMASVKMEIQL